jgi:predicted alpha/beta-fold hydrolase
MSIDWLYPCEKNWGGPYEVFTRENNTDIDHNDKKIVIVFPGLGGGSDRGYIKYLVKYLAQGKNGYIVGVLHGRGSGYTEITSENFQDLNRLSDWHQAINFVG